MQRATAPAIQLGMCVTSVYEDGFVGIQVDAFGEQDSGVQPMEALHAYGFEGRPLDRDDSEAGCSAMYWWDGDDGHVIAAGDSRGSDYLPQLTKGSSRQYNARGQFLLFDYDSETATLYTPYESGSKAHVLTMGLDGNDDDYVGLVQALGLALLMVGKRLTVKNAAGDAYIELNDTGIVLNGNTKLIGGLDVGGDGAQPVLNGTLFLAWWSALASTITSSGTVPLTGATLGAAMQTAASGLTSVNTQLLKGL